MKKVKIVSIGIIIIVLALLPFVAGNLEKEELNSITRSRLSNTFIELSDGVTHYELTGVTDHPTIILVHGNAAPFPTWDYTVEPLVKAGFRVLRFDLFGHGYSDRPPIEVYNNALYSRQLNEIINKLEIKEPVFLVGTSQGGSICAYFAAENPHKVAKLALLAPLFDDFTGKAMWNLLKVKGIGEYAISILGDIFFTNPSKVLYGKEKHKELSDKLLLQMHFIGKKRAVLANIRGDALDDATKYYEQVKLQGIPVLLTWGDHDNSISRESIHRLRALFPKISYYEIKNASHLAHYEYPEKVNPLLVDFFKKQ